MEEEKNELNDNKSNKSLKKSNESNELKEPIYKMTIESEKGRKEIINIYPNSKPEEIAYNFCKENNLDFKTLELMISKVKILIETMAKKRDEKENINSENDKKISYCNEPILEDSEEQQSLSTEKIKKTISFKEKALQIKDKEKEKENNKDNDNKNDVNNNKSDKNDNGNNLGLNYFKINEDFKEKKILNNKTSSVITSTINNCLELIEKEEKYFVSSSSTFSSKLGSSSFQNQNFSINSKENINLFNIDKDKDKVNQMSKRSSNSNNNNINPKIIISKSFINNIPPNINNNYLNMNSRNNCLTERNNTNSNLNLNKKENNKNELNSKSNKTVSDDHKYSNKTKSLKNSSITVLKNSLNNNEYYINKQKEILKNNKIKNFQRIINMIKKNNIDINQISSENLIKNNNSKKTTRKVKNNNEPKLINSNYKMKLNNNTHYGLSNKVNNLKINPVNNNFKQSSKENIYYTDTDKDNFYSLSKNEENSTLNNMIKNSLSSHYIPSNKYPISENFNSIMHEINITILPKPRKTNNLQNKNLIILGNKNKNNKIKDRNYQTLSDVNKNKYSFPQDKKIRDLKNKILLNKSNDITKSKQKNMNNNYDKKLSPRNENHKENSIKKKHNFLSNVNINSPLIMKDFFKESKLKKFKNNFKSPQHNHHSQMIMKNFIIKKNKTNMYKDSFIKNNNKALLSQSSKNNNKNNYSSSFIKRRSGSFNDFNSNINNIFINLKYSNNKKNLVGQAYSDKFNLDGNSYLNQQQNKKNSTKKRNISHALSSTKVKYSSNSLEFKKSINETIDKSSQNNMNLNLNITSENNNSYSLKNRKKTKSNNSKPIKNKFNNKCSSKSNLSKKRPGYLFIKSQNSSPPSTSRKKKKNHSTLFQNSSLTIGLLKRNKIANSLKNIFNFLSNKNNRIDIFKINKNNNIPDDIIKPIQHIIQNCEQNQGAISSKEFIMKGSLLFDKLTIEEQISILNFLK